MRFFVIQLAQVVTCSYIFQARYSDSMSCKCIEAKDHQKGGFNTEDECLKAYANKTSEFCLYKDTGGYRPELASLAVSLKKCEDDVKCQTLYKAIEKGRTAAEHTKSFKAFLEGGCVMKNTMLWLEKEGDEDDRLRCKRASIPTTVSSENDWASRNVPIAAAGTSLIGVSIGAVAFRRLRRQEAQEQPAEFDRLPRELATYEREASAIATADMFA